MKPCLINPLPYLPRRKQDLPHSKVQIERAFFFFFSAPVRYDFCSKRPKNFEALVVENPFWGREGPTRTLPMIWVALFVVCPAMYVEILEVLVDFYVYGNARRSELDCVDF